MQRKARRSSLLLLEDKGFIFKPLAQREWPKDEDKSHGVVVYFSLQFFGRNSPSRNPYAFWRFQITQPLHKDGDCNSPVISVIPKKRSHLSASPQVPALSDFVSSRKSSDPTTMEIIKDC